MDYSLITHSLKDRITVEDRTYMIDTRTTKALQALAILDEREMPEGYRIERVLDTMLTGAARVHLDANKQDILAVHDGIIAFLKGWPEPESYVKIPHKKSAEEILSYSEDHALILAAFRQAYGISLAELKALHWWEFRALLTGIPESTVLGNVMSIRGMKISPKASPEVKKKKREAKASVRLHVQKDPDVSGEDIISAAFSSL